MKKLTLLLLTILTLNFSINAQELDATDRVRKNQIGFELLDLIDGAYQLSYERLAYKNFSFVIGAGLKTEDGLVNLSGIHPVDHQVSVYKIPCGY